MRERKIDFCFPETSDTTCMSEEEKAKYQAMLQEVERSKLTVQGMANAANEEPEWDEQQDDSDQDDDISVIDHQSPIEKAQTATINAEKVRLKAMLKKKVQFYNERKIILLCNNHDGYSFDHHPDDMGLQDRSFFDEALRKQKARPENRNGATDVNTAQKGKRQASDKADHNRAKKRRAAPAWIEDQAEELGRDGQLSEEDSDNSDEEVPGVVPDSQEHASMPVRSKFESEGLDLDWKPWAESTLGTKFLWAQNRFDIYVTEDVMDQSQLRIRNFAYRKHEINADLGRSVSVVRIQNICFFEGVDSTFCLELMQTLREHTSAVVVASSPCVNDGEFDFTQLEGVKKVNETRMGKAKKRLSKLLEKAKLDKPANDKKIKLLQIELTDLSRIKYEFRIANTCYCGCGVPANGTHKCKVCKESFFPACMMMKEDDIGHGVCLLCNDEETSLQRAVNGSIETSDDDSDGINQNDKTILSAFRPVVRTRRALIDDDDEED